jgi:quercetin dioxygenase-like cupin family protein
MQTLHAYKRSPALENSTWYKGILVSQLAGGADTDGAFDLVESKMKKGIEPPPHIHGREDELFYILAGEIKVFAEGKAFTVAAGESVFLPKQGPHAYLIQFGECQVLALMTPGGFLNAINKMNAPARAMEIPHDAESPTRRRQRHGLVEIGAKNLLSDDHVLPDEREWSSIEGPCIIL